MLPLLGCHPIQHIIEYVYDSIVDEATAAEFYGRLLKEAPNDLHREFMDLCQYFGQKFRFFIVLCHPS